MILTIAYRDEHAGNQHYEEIHVADRTEAIELMVDFDARNQASFTCECCRPTGWLENEDGVVEKIEIAWV